MYQHKLIHRPADGNEKAVTLPKFLNFLSLKKKLIYHILNNSGFPQAEGGNRQFFCLVRTLPDRIQFKVGNLKIVVRVYLSTLDAWYAFVDSYNYNNMHC